MNRLTRWLQTNPLVVLTMFVISLTSGLAGLVLGWPQLYRDYLSKTVELPVWLILASLLLLAIGFVALKNPTTSSNPKEVEQVEGKRFGVQRLILDGKQFTRCEFLGTELIFQGRARFGISKSNLENSRLTYDRHAATTLLMLTSLYKDPSFRPLVEQVLQGIRDGEHPESIDPASEG